jgi:solute carrier family 35 protein F5
MCTHTPVTERQAAGLALIFLVVLIWTAAGFATQYLETVLDYDSPFVFTWISISLFVLNFPIHYLTMGKRERKSHLNEEEIRHLRPAPKYNQLAQSVEDRPPGPATEDRSHHPSQHDHINMALSALMLAPLLFMGNYFYNKSLMFTSVSSCIVITNLNGSFTLFFSYWMGVEDASQTKVWGVILCLIGVVLVALGDRTEEISNVSTDSSNVIFGDLLALLGAVSYGLYTTLIKVKIGEKESSSKGMLLFGYMGMWILVLGSPVIIYMAIIRSSSIEGLTGNILAFIFGEEIFDSVVANQLYAAAAVLTSPSVAAVGEALTIPLTIIADFLFVSGISVTVYTVVGGFLVTLGFLVLALGPSLYAIVP